MWIHKGIQMAWTLISAGSSVRVALGHHHRVWMTYRAVLEKAGQHSRASSKQHVLGPEKAWSWVSNILHTHYWCRALLSNSFVDRDQNSNTSKKNINKTKLRKKNYRIGNPYPPSYYHHQLKKIHD